jgi:plastocyanin
MKAFKLSNIFHFIPQRIVIDVCCIILFFWCFNVFSGSIKVVDQFGNPVENVVVSFNEDAPSTLDVSDVAMMDQVNMQFLPRVLIIQKNQSVSFPNSDDTRHHIYSFSKPKPFEIKMFKGGESKNLTFEQSGIVVLGCNIHDEMVGYIYVAENSNTAITDAQGIAEVPVFGITLKLWHPRLSTNKIVRKDIQLPATLNEDPYPIVLTLLEDVASPAKRTFKSKKFNRGNQ